MLGRPNTQSSFCNVEAHGYVKEGHFLLRMVRNIEGLPSRLKTVCIFLTVPIFTLANLDSLTSHL